MAGRRPDRLLPGGGGFRPFPPALHGGWIAELPLRRPSYELTQQKGRDQLNRLSLGPIEFTSEAGVRMIALETLVDQISDGMDIVWAIPDASGWVSIARALQANHEAGKTSPRPEHTAANRPPRVCGLRWGGGRNGRHVRQRPLRVAGAVPDARLGGHAPFRLLPLSTSFMEFSCSSSAVDAAEAGVGVGPGRRGRGALGLPRPPLRQGPGRHGHRQRRRALIRRAGPRDHPPLARGPTDGAGPRSD